LFISVYALFVCFGNVLEVFSAGRSKNQFLFMFTGCVRCCTFLFIDVIVGWFVLLFVLCFRFCFQMFKYIKKGYYVLEFFIGVGNRDIMTKELSQICLFFVMFCLNIFSARDSLSQVNPILFFKQGMF
jgi:hypothetical protein